MELQHGDSFLESLENHLNTLGGTGTTAIGGLLHNLTNVGEKIKPDTSFTETMVPLDSTLKSGKGTSFAPSSLYDIKAELMKNKAANPVIKTLSDVPNFIQAEATGAAAEAEVAKNFKLEDMFKALGGAGGLSMGAVMPPYLSEIIQKARDQQFNERGGT